MKQPVYRHIHAFNRTGAGLVFQSLSSATPVFAETNLARFLETKPFFTHCCTDCGFIPHILAKADWLPAFEIASSRACLITVLSSVALIFKP